MFFDYFYFSGVSKSVAIGAEDDRVDWYIGSAISAVVDTMNI